MTEQQRFWFLIAIGYGILIVSILVLLFFSVHLGIKVNPGQLALGMLIGYTILSVRIVREDELAVKVLLGLPIQEVGPGPAFVPLFFCRLRRESRLVFQKEFPGEPQQIFFDEGTVPPDMVRPIRITTGGDTNPATNDPVDRRMTVEVTYFIRLRILSLLQFITTIGTPEQSLRQIEDTINPVIQTEFATRTPRMIIQDFSLINQQMMAAVQALVAGIVQTPTGAVATGGEWGVQILNLNLKAPDLGKTVNTALRDVPAAQLKAQAAIAAATAEAESTRLTGTQIAAVRQLFLTAESVGLQQIAAALGITDQSQAVALLQSQLARDALARAGNITIYSGGVASLLSLVDAARQQTGPSAPTP